MSFVSLLIILIVIGVLVWAATTYIPMDPGMKTMIRIVGIAAGLFIVLRAFGVIGSINEVKVPSLK